MMNILITGASGGIGSALAQAFHSNGDRVLLHGRNELALQTLAKRIDPAMARTKWLCADLNDPNDRLRLVVAAADFGVDTLVNNAGINEFCRFEDAAIQAVIQTNVISTMQITQALLPVLIKQSTPRIVNVGSTFGAIGYPGYVSYCAAKHALKGFSEALQREYSDSSLNVIYVSPRATETDMNSSAVAQMNKSLGVATDKPEVVAQRILLAVQRNETRAQLGFTEWLQTKLNGLVPSLVDTAIRKQLVTINQYLNKESKNEITIDVGTSDVTDAAGHS
jgi:short-subunit dehydrogenase